MSIRKGFKVQRAQLADRVPTPFLVYSNGSDHNSVQTVLITTGQLLSILEALGLLHDRNVLLFAEGEGSRECVRALRADLDRLLQAI